MSPLFYTPARYTDFYWVSAPTAQHSRNLAERPQVQIVIFDSTAGVGRGEAVYITAAARQVGAHELGAVCPEAFRAVPGARRFQPGELRDGAAIRLYVARASSWEVHIPARHPVHGRGVDTRQPVSPAPA